MELTKTIVVGGNSYTTKFPKVGQIIDIKVLENQLSKGMSKELVTGLPEDLDVYIYISAYAHFTVLFPDLLKDLKVSNLLELDLRDYEELVKEFIKVKEWINEVRESLHKKVEEINEE